MLGALVIGKALPSWGRFLMAIQRALLGICAQETVEKSAEVETVVAFWWDECYDVHVLSM